ncbi:MAG: DUF2321 domain-containing protein [Planctomycetes bacterium]|nr:DUF2321 domain-containing protein [Planctomycetota bacterium]
MVTTLDESQDVMQVCRNGHVITDRLRGDPDSGRSHCDRCGAVTFYHCPTCGGEFPGALDVTGLAPIGGRPAPHYCLMCGAALPWVRRARPAPEPVAALEGLLRRLPLAIRQLRWRQGDRPPYRVEDERDLEDLLRALLTLPFDDVRLEGRTPAYSPRNRTDLLLSRGKIALTVKFARPDLREPQLAEQLMQDALYYRERGGCRTLVGYVYDPEGTLRDIRRAESIGAGWAEGLEVRCIVSGLVDAEGGNFTTPLEIGTFLPQVEPIRPFANGGAGSLR